MIATLIFALVGSALADDPLRGSCMCVTGSKLHVRSSAGLSINNVVGVATDGDCFVYAGKALKRDGLSWLKIGFKGQEAWVVKNYLKIGNNSSCSTQPVSCGSGGPFDQRCLNCICQIESGCRPIGCHMDVGSLSCGYFQIKQPYYVDCHSPGSGWKACADDLSCATTCVHNYINRYYKPCTGSPSPQCCEEAARIHNGGPKGCQKSSTLGYWNKVQACLRGL